MPRFDEPRAGDSVPRLSRVPTGYDVPATHVFIDCVGLDIARTVELLIDRLVMTEVQIEQTGDRRGEATLLYTLPSGSVRAMQNIGGGSGTFLRSRLGNAMISIKAGEEGVSHVVTLRYRP